MRIVVAGGGTGGHLFPGIAFASAIQQRFDGTRVMFIGTQRLLDQKALAGYDFELDSIKCMGLKGMGLKYRVKSVLQLPAALLEARNIIQRFKPDLVLGVGGYVTGPVLLAARISGIPICIHEQNSIPGLANKILSKIASKIFISMPCRYRFPENKTVMTGNPVRLEIIQASSEPDMSEKKEVTILILGGSQGAHRVNSLVTEAASDLAREYGQRITMLHQTGIADEDKVRACYQQLGVRAEVRAFFDDMAALYRKADLVISRAGATTLAELSVMGLPALLIPYPYAADDHQQTNALYYQDGGAAAMFLESELSGEKLFKEIRGLLNNVQLLKQMSAQMKSMGKPEATDNIINECLKLIDNNRAKIEAREQ